MYSIKPLELAQRNTELIDINLPRSLPGTSAAVSTSTPEEEQKGPKNSRNANCETAVFAEKCYFCGKNKHPRSQCPAREVICYRCHKIGHFSKVCRSKTTGNAHSVAVNSSTVLGISAPKTHTSKTNLQIKVNGRVVSALLDTGSTLNHVSKNAAKRLNLKLTSERNSVGLAIKGRSYTSTGTCNAEIELNSRKYENVRLSVLEDLLTDVILGQDFMQQHESVNIMFGGRKPSLFVGALKTLKTIKPPVLFEHLSTDCRPIVTKSRRFSEVDKRFIKREIERLLTEGIIEPSTSPWRAQVVVTSNANQKKDFALTTAKQLISLLVLMVTRCHACKT